MPPAAVAQTTRDGAVPLKERNIGVSREEANRQPRNEADQAIVDGWPLYRTERGQAAFNDTMATLKASEGASPRPDAFKGCVRLHCNLVLPAIGHDGWIPAGRIWVSPSEYVLVVHSPRLAGRRSIRRHGTRGMSYFVFHEFHNSTRNTDAFDTISSHSGLVFVPFYMTKPETDSRGRRFVAILQVAPYDVVSVHATNYGSAGPGIEVAKNAADPLEPLQGLAGIVVASIVKKAAPRLDVVNHRGEEGLPMLEIYDRRLEAVKASPRAPAVALPFFPAAEQRLATVTGNLDEVITRPGQKPRFAIAEAAATAKASPKLVGPIKLARQSVLPAAQTSAVPPRPAQRPASTGVAK